MSLRVVKIHLQYPNVMDSQPILEVSLLVEMCEMFVVGPLAMQQNKTRSIPDLCTTISIIMDFHTYTHTHTHTRTYCKLLALCLWELWGRCEDCLSLLVSYTVVSYCAWLIIEVIGVHFSTWKLLIIHIHCVIHRCFFFLLSVRWMRMVECVSRVSLAE